MASASTSWRTQLRSPRATEAPKESVITRLLISPLIFISFLFSLALIDSRNYSFRQHSHPNSQDAPTTIFGRIKAFLHPIFFKRISSPYVYVKSPEAKSSGAGNGTREEEPWHWHTHQRKMMKAEMDDAFRLRRSVMLVLIGLLIGTILVLATVIRWGWGLLIRKIVENHGIGMYLPW
ncbi:Uncharacterized protein BP5553_00046 [Venustampulla echinocandica]|uniref:Uncharacterized protein n=1 Tax=Venustampulla echinocandica TaxID=2656787 RepID=A0A370TX23_9HELO|nr:Uncharacterized protein BP5553_00046 [Venustampulla echinocandica]RDL40067.1 Uncharacterized protein BP5553_00046 [Venustampulla echinocandica]